MFKNQNDIVFDVIEERYKNLITTLEQFISKVNENVSVEDIFNRIDCILIKLLILFTYENRLINKKTNRDFIKHIKAHELLLYDLVKVFKNEDVSSDDYLVVMGKLLDKIKKHFEKYNSSRDLNTIYMSDIMGEKKYFGCILFVVCEYGFFIKVYGETNQELLSEMITRANGYREHFFDENVEWGEVIDFRNWKLMTNDSMVLAKKNTDSARKRNKKYTLYMTGDSKINEYITKSISIEAEIFTMNTENLFHTLQVMKQNSLKLGNVITIDSIGDLSFVEEC